MKGIDVTPEQLAHAEDFLLRIAHGSELRRGVVYYNTQALSLKRQDLIRLLAWYGAIRAKGGRETPAPLVNRTGSGSTMDFGTPEQLAEMEPDLRWPCGGWRGSQNQEATDPTCPRVEAESVAVGHTERAALHIQPNDSTDDPCIGDDRARIIYKDGTDPAELLQGDEDMPEVNCGTFTDQPLSRAETVKRQSQIIRKLHQRIGELEKSLTESRKHCTAWADQVSRAEGDRDIAPALAALNALHRVDIVNLLAQYDAVIEGRTEVDEEEYEPDPEDAAVVEDIRVRWTGSVL